MENKFKEDLEFIEELGSNAELFNREFKKIEKVYPMENNEEIYNFLSENPGVIVILNHVESLLLKYVPYSVFSLKLDDDPIFVPQLLLIVKAPRINFENGFKEDIRKINSEIRPLLLKFDLITEFFIFERILREN
jgi:hypothetical protein